MKGPNLNSNNKDSISWDLNEIAELLNMYNVIRDAKGLYEASEKVRSTGNEDVWGYECNNLAFSIDGTLAGAIPREVSCFDVIFNIKIVGNYRQEDHYVDPVRELNFDLEVLALSSKSSDLYACWHFDKHIGEESDGICSYSHPEYHLTFGGNKMEARGEHFGDCFILPTPRISYPPMDAILGIDFIIQNYIPFEKRKKLMTDPKYREIVRNSQNRFWKPYFTSITSYWHSFQGIAINENFHHSKLFPLLH